MDTTIYPFNSWWVSNWVFRWVFGSLQHTISLVRGSCVHIKLCFSYVNTYKWNTGHMLTVQNSMDLLAPGPLPELSKRVRIQVRVAGERCTSV